MRRAVLRSLAAAAVFALASVVPPMAAQAQTAGGSGGSLPAWVPFTLGLAGQAVAFAYFMGRLSGRVVSLEAKIAEIAAAIAVGSKRLDEMDDFTGESATDRATMRLRLEQVEENTRAIQGQREEMIIYRTTTSVQLERIESTLGRLDQRVNALSRSVQNVATGRAGRVQSMMDAEGE